MIKAQSIKDKATIINAIKQINSKSDKPIEFVGLAPTIKATAELQDKGINSQTMQSFLSDELNIGSGVNNTAKTNYSNKVFLLDEFSMASNKDISQLMKIINDTGAKSFYLGDRKQLDSQESGSPIDLMIRKEVVDVVTMTDIKRQKTAPYLNAIKAMINEDTHLATKMLSMQDAKGTPYEGKPGIFDLSTSKEEYKGDLIKDFIQFQKSEQNVFTGKIIEKPSFSDIYKYLDAIHDYNAIKDLTIASLAKEYLSLSPKIRDETLIVANAHNDRDVIHNHIRESLKSTNELQTDKSIVVDRLRHHNLTEAQLRELKTIEKYFEKGEEKTRIVNRYKEGMVFQQGNNKFSTIKSVNDKEGYVSLVDTVTKKESIIYPAKLDHRFNTLYEVHRDDVAVGDKLMLRSDDKENNIRKNDRVEVTDIKDGVIYAKNDEKEIKLNSSNAKHMIMEYGYTNTSCSSQGMNVNFVMPYTKSISPLSTYKSLYVQLSRGRYHAMMFTDNLSNTVKNLKNTEKTMSHSVIENLQAIPGADLKLEPIETVQSKKVDSKVNTSNNTSKLQYENKSTGVLSQLPHEILKDPQYLDHNNKFNIKSYGNEIAKDLIKYTESIAQQYLGEPNRKESNSHVMAFGSSGAMKVTLTGEHRGKWKDWSDNNKHGDLITLIKEQGNLSYTEAVIEASKIIGQPTNFSIKETENSKELSTATTATKSKSYEYGQKIWQEATPIKGTLAEKYLENRGIENTDLTGLRYHYGAYTKESPTNFQPALVAAFTDKDRNINAIEVIYLDKETGLKAQGFHTGKRTYGSKNGSAIDLSPYNQDTNISLIAEGAITGLSVKEAYPNEHVIAVGGKENISNINPDILNDKVIICADNDGKDISKDNSLNHAIHALEEAGKTVEIVCPQDIEGMQKVDFNDTLNHTNLDAIKSLIDDAIDRLPHDNMSKDINVEKLVNEIEHNIDTNIDLKEIANELNISSEKELVEHMISDKYFDEIYTNDIDINIDEIVKSEDYNIEELSNDTIDKDLELER